ncbi:MAG: arylformamidase [Parcubacteria group bacterium Gr01-1014_33]|nr:MAG: arylformamidase [Parcubacteria group bacterium Gr01-1014_33]
MAKQPHIFDISLSIHKGMITYPGNPVPDIVSFDTKTSQQTKTSYLSKINIGSHTGTHIDAPRHVFENGKGLEAFSLAQCIGPCRVLDFSGVKEAIFVKDLQKEKIKKGERILVKTSNSKRGFTKFYDDFVYLDGDAAEFLAAKGIILFGIDALSIKKRGGTDHRPHTALLRKNIAILEGLDLSKVRPGKYFLIALPLRFKNLDGAPARVVLLKE